METSRLARTFALASFLGTASLVGGVATDVLGPEEAEAGYEVDESYFYVSLSSYGSWVQNAQFGWVWYPASRPYGWRPYTVGHWAWTDYGEWMWVSDEPYGWATYHYGRWALDPYYGWVWIPGTVWAPAWVSWRDCDDYIGWAPLGPWGYWDAHYGGYRGWDDWHHHHNDHWDNDDWDHHNGGHGGGGHGGGGHGDGGHGDNDGRGPGRGGSGHGDFAQGGRGDDRDSWNFTRKRDFNSPRVDKVMLDRKQMPGVFDRSRPLPPPSKEDERAGRGVSRGIGKDQIERASGRAIRPVRVEEDAAPPQRGGNRGQDARVHGQDARGDGGRGNHDSVRVFRPNVKQGGDRRTPDQLGVAKVDRGGRGGNGDDVRGSRKPEIDTGGRERAARKDEAGGFERPARDDERGGYERGGKDSRGERGAQTGGRGGSDEATRGNRGNDHATRGGDEAMRGNHGNEAASRGNDRVSREPRSLRGNDSDPYRAPTTSQRQIEGQPRGHGFDRIEREPQPHIEHVPGSERPQSQPGAGRGDVKTQSPERHGFGRPSASAPSYGGGAPSSRSGSPDRHGFGSPSTSRGGASSGSPERHGYSSPSPSQGGRPSYGGGQSQGGGHGAGPSPGASHGGYSGGGGSQGGGGSHGGGGGGSHGSGGSHGGYSSSSSSSGGYSGSGYSGGSAPGGGSMGGSSGGGMSGGGGRGH